MDSSIKTIAYDQAHFNIDADVRRCWSFRGEPPIVYRNGSKKGISVGGAFSDDGSFHYHQLPWQVKETVLENIKAIHDVHPKMFLLLDRATWNNNKLVRNYLEQERIEYLFFPRGASDLNPVEECWKQTRDAVTANISHNSEEHLFKDLSAFWKKQPFKHNLLNYLSP